MRPTLRPYQTLAVEHGLASLERGKPEIIVAPTASGKSLIASEIAHSLKEPTLILQPSKEILEQNYNKLKLYGVEDVAIYSAAMGSKDIGQYTYATIGSIKDYSLFKHFRYLIIDECHNVGGSAGMYRKFIKATPKMKVIGMTATPYRMQQRFYQEGRSTFYTAMLRVMTAIHPPFFKGFAFKITNKRLFEEGYLARLEYSTPTNIDISSIAINSTGADFREDQLESFLNSADNVRKLAQAIIAEDEFTPNNLIFCSSIMHARNTAELLGSMGYDSEVVTGDDPKRDEKIADFRSGKIKRLLNAMVLTTGFDFPGLYQVTLGRPTMSLGLLYQMVGRVMRLNPADPNKFGKVVDVCNNIRRLGTIESIRITQNPFTKKDQIETDRGVISDKPLFTFKVTDPTKHRLIT